MIANVVISTHAPRTGSDAVQFDAGCFVYISTHAPRTGSDCARCWSLSARCLNFNPRSPHGERRSLRHQLPVLLSFQPTLPARGATIVLRGSYRSYAFQPTLPARGATPPLCAVVLCIDVFQPTLPARGATVIRPHWRFQHDISTHAPRTGSDDACFARAHGICISTHAPRTGSDVRWRGHVLDL